MIYPLSSYTFPEHDGPSRDVKVGEASRPDGFEDRYDFKTLFYDAIYVPERSAVVLFCPKLLNFQSLIEASTIKVDGVATAKVRFKYLRRCDEVWIKVKTPATRIQINGPDIDVDLPVRNNCADYAGRRVMVTRSKDNPLEWIEDWVRFHIKHQKVDAILFIDNGSTLYTPVELDRALSAIDGLEAVGVVAAPFRYGGSNTGPLKHLTKYFQSSMLNLVKRRFFTQAAGVLWHDVDELVISDQGTVFDEAAKSWLGYVTIPGLWRYAPEVDGRMPMHSDHIYRKDPDAGCKEKFCLVPNRWAAQGSWDVHGVRRYFLNGLVKSKTSRFLHCENLSTSWKRNRTTRSVKSMVIDPVAQALWRDAE